MSRTERDQIPFRLAPDRMRRLERAARKQGLTRQAFIENAVMERIVDDEERRRANKEEHEPKLKNREEIDPSSSPSGLGVAALLRPPPVPSSIPEPPPSPAPVVVHVGNTGSGGDVISFLATYVLAADDFERTSRMRTTANILAASCTTPEERQVMGAKLDEAIAYRKRTAAPNNVLSRSFEKLTNLLKGRDG